MLKLLMLIICTYKCISAIPIEKPIPILSEEIVVEHNGNYHFSYESGDGTKFHEEGQATVLDPEHSIESVHGGYEYSSPEGQKIAVQYVANENGFQPSSDILPVGPPIPAEIAKAIKFNEEHPQSTEKYT